MIEPRRLLDRYELTEVLGEGGQYRAYLAIDRWLNRRVVAKELSSGTEAATARREFQLLSELHHPNIVEACGLAWAEDRLWVIQTHAAGPDLLRWSAPPRAPSQICLAVAAVARGLHYLHRHGVVHRDIKPENIRVGDGRIGRLPAARLLDLGLATASPEAGVTGSLGYMAAEVMNGAPASPASDLYSLGVVLYQALAGRLPGSPADPLPSGRLGAEDPARARLLSELVSDLLAAHPAHRPSADALLDGLAEVTGEATRLSLEELRGDYFPRPTLVGRTAQLEVLSGLLSEVRAGATRLLQVTGKGKTAFVSAAAVQSQLAGLRCLEIGTRDAVLRLVRSGEERPVDQLVTVAVDELRERLSAAPLALVLDAHVADQPLVAALVRQLAVVLEQSPQPCLVLWTGVLPEEVRGRWVPLPLPDLDRAEVSELVGGMLDFQTAPAWLDEVHPCTGGDPRLAVELVRLQIEAGLPRELVSSGELAALAAGHLAVLSPTQREVLSVIASTPRPLPASVLAEVAPWGLGEVGALLGRGLLVASDEGVGLSRSLLRGQVMAGRTPEAAGALHRELARAWAREPALGPEVLAHHHLHGGEIEEAARWMVQAKLPDEPDLELLLARLARSSAHFVPLASRLARQRRVKGDLEGALAVAGAVGEASPSAGTLLRAELLLDAGEPTQALAIADALAHPTPESHLMSARCAVLLGDFQRATTSARAGLEAGGVPPLLRAQLSNVLGLSLCYRGEVEQGLSVLGGAEELARQSGEGEVLPRLLNSRAMALQRLGRLDEAAAAYSESQQLFQRRGDLRLAATSAMNLGTLAQSQLDLGRALGAYRQASALGERGALGSTRAWAEANHANLLLLVGAVEEAEAKLGLCREAASREGGRLLLARVALYGAEVSLARDRLDEAAERLAEARRLLDPSDRLATKASRLIEGELLLARRDPAAAARQARQLAQELGPDDPDRVRALLTLARAALAGGDVELEQALESLERSLTGATPRERDWEAHAVLAEAEQRRGDGERAGRQARAFQAALEELRRRVPTEYRQAFDARADVQSARQRMTGLLRSSSVSPSVKGVFRLLEINKELNQGLPLDQQLGRILDGAIELARAERGFILLRRGGKLRLAASRTLDREPLRRGAAKFSRSIAQRAIKQARPVLVADASSDERFRQTFSVAGLKLRAVLCVPLNVRGEVKGVLYLDNRFSSDAFDEATVTLTQAFADQAGIALENTRLLEEAAAQREQLIQAKAELEQLNQRLMSEVERQSQELSEITVRLQHHEAELIRRYNATRLIGRSKPMRELFAKMERVADADVPVVIYGESGTGKELVARALHYTGCRAEQPFVAINCGAIPASLLESELFGHARGAFTGADRDRPGVFEAAKGGTLLLDEIGDMPLEMQVKLLRVIQEGTFRRLGDETERRSGCRVLSASHRSLKELVAAGAFREDLFYRLHVIQLEVAPLRQRREDIPALVKHFLGEERGRAASITPAALQALMDHSWPGNIRQLENELRRAALLCEGTIEWAHLSPEIRGSARAPSSNAPAGLKDALHDYERRLIESTLAETGGNVSLAARKLQIHRVQLHAKMRALGVVRRPT